MNTIVAVLWLVVQVPGTNLHDVVMFENFNNARECYTLAEEWNNNFINGAQIEKGAIAVCAPYIVSKEAGVKV